MATVKERVGGGGCGDLVWWVLVMEIGQSLQTKDSQLQTWNKLVLLSVSIKMRWLVKSVSAKMRWLVKLPKCIVM